MTVTAPFPAAAQAPPSVPASADHASNHTVCQVPGKRVLLLGCGLSAPPFVFYLAAHGYRIVIASRTKSRAEAVCASLPLEEQRARIECVEYDAHADDQTKGMPKLRSILEQSQTDAGTDAASRIGVLVSLLPYAFHPVIARLALDLQLNCATASYVSPAMSQLHDEASKAGLLFINEIGVDPGLDHASAQRFIDAVHGGTAISARGARGTIRSFLSLCGGLPAPHSDTNPLHYKLSWSPRGVLLASQNAARWQQNFGIRELSGAVLYERGVGYREMTVELASPLRNVRGEPVNELRLSAYANRDSTLYSKLFRGLESDTCATLLRGTFRSEGWCSFMRALTKHQFTKQTQDETTMQLAKSGSSLPVFTLRMLGVSQSDAESQIGSLSADELSSRVKSLLANAETSGSIDDATLDSILERFTFLGLLDKDVKVIETAQSPLDVICARFEATLQYADGEQDMIVMEHRFDVDWKPSQQQLAAATQSDAAEAPLAQLDSILVSLNIARHRSQYTCALIDIGHQRPKAEASRPVTDSNLSPVQSAMLSGGHSSMSRTVSIPLGISVRALLDGRFDALPCGVQQPMTPLFYNLVLDELASQHGIEFKERRQPVHLWLRAECKQGEARSMITPSDAAALIRAGCRVTIERSAQRCIDTNDFAALGCELADEGAWKDEAPLSAFVCGLKELPETTEPLLHRHLMFAHCFKGQAGAQELLSRFKRGKGLLLDLEFLVDDTGRRVAAFGRAAGIVGAALGIVQWSRQQLGQASIAHLKPWASTEEMLNECRLALAAVANQSSPASSGPRVHVLGAKGRCGQGAEWVFRQCGIDSSRIALWDLDETRAGGPFAPLLEADILVNAIYLTKKTPPFVTQQMITQNQSTRALQVIVDVSCDPTSPNNPLPVYSAITTLQEPITMVEGTSASNQKPCSVIAIDHLPSLLPHESSQEFSAALLPHLLQLVKAEAASPASASASASDSQSSDWSRVWRRAALKCAEHLQQCKI